MTDVLRTAHEWLAEMNAQKPGKLVTIADPDGWRHNDGVTLETPITHDNFLRRLAESSVMPVSS